MYILYFYTVEVQSRARCRFKVLHQRSYPGTCINLLPSNYLQTGYLHAACFLPGTGLAPPGPGYFAKATASSLTDQTRQRASPLAS
jgi:hypothetical protein